MSPQPPPSAALPIAFVVLRILVFLNFLTGILLIVLLGLMPYQQWILKALKIPAGSDADQVIMALTTIALLGLASVPINFLILKRLIAMVETVRAGDPFVAANAVRLQAIAWMLLALQVISIIIGAIARSVSTPEHPIRLDAGFSINGWLAVLLTFLLARVFAEGTHLRDDLEGVV